MYAENIPTRERWMTELEKLTKSPVKTTDYFGELKKT